MGDNGIFYEGGLSVGLFGGIVIFILKATENVQDQFCDKREEYHKQSAGLILLHQSPKAFETPA